MRKIISWYWLDMPIGGWVKPLNHSCKFGNGCLLSNLTFKLLCWNFYQEDTIWRINLLFFFGLISFLYLTISSNACPIKSCIYIYILFIFFKCVSSFEKFGLLWMTWCTLICHIIGLISRSQKSIGYIINNLFTWLNRSQCFSMESEIFYHK